MVTSSWVIIFRLLLLHYMNLPGNPRHNLRMSLAGMQLIECVPNFSEGRDQGKIRAIVEAIDRVPEVQVLDVDSGIAANRTVVTIIGPPARVVEAAFQGIRKAAGVIDMRQHKGAHPRMGATDVCPLVPIRGLTMNECVAWAKILAARVGQELNIPVYLYEQAATSPMRQSLARIRQGEYEGWESKIHDPEWQPDYGPAKFNPRAGCLTVGARNFLIAYNINLKTSQVEYATDIALNLRTRGRSVRTGNLNPLYAKGEIKRHREGEYFCGSCEFSAATVPALAEHTQSVHGYDLYWLLREHDQDPEHLSGATVKRPGKFQHLKAMGWYIEEYRCAQISMNLTDYTQTPLHAVYEESKQEARERGIAVTGSEIVGMVPYQALLAAGIFYLRQSGNSMDQAPERILETAVTSLGLRDKTEFQIEQKVLGFPAMESGELPIVGKVGR